PEIGADGVGLDSAITLDNDGIDRLRHGVAHGQHHAAATADKYAAEDEAASDPSPNSPHTNPHALRALMIDAAAPTAVRQTVQAAIGRLFTAFSGHCKRNSARTFPFPSKSCPSATLRKWRGAGCH